jgi:hypothetical protein
MLEQTTNRVVDTRSAFFKMSGVQFKSYFKLGLEE